MDGTRSQWVAVAWLMLASLIVGASVGLSIRSDQPPPRQSEEVIQSD